jgi:hypothetical protein
VIATLYKKKIQDAASRLVIRSELSAAKQKEVSPKDLRVETPTSAVCLEFNLHRGSRIVEAVEVSTGIQNKSDALEKSSTNRSTVIRNGAAIKMI